MVVATSWYNQGGHLMSVVIMTNVNIMRHWVEVAKFVVVFAHVLLQIFKGVMLVAIRPSMLHGHCNNITC